MPDKEFNLLHEPWICVMTPDTEVKEVSILDAFRHAHEYRAISGELPTQNVAILRLLLAILHAVFGRVDVEGNAFDEDGESNALCDLEPKFAYDRWQSLWELGKFPMKPIEDYLSHYEERFWLFHPETPFYQVADTVGTLNYASKLNAEMNQSQNKIRLFKSRAGRHISSLTYAESARYLVHIIGFDDASTKKGTGTGVAWLGQLGIIHAQGNNLFESLLLNLVLTNTRDNSNWKNEKPYWEFDVCKELARKLPNHPDNLSQLYTLQSRRILLNRFESQVISYLDAGGDYFETGNENVFIEQMTMWKKDKKKELYSPMRHWSNRQIWRDLEGILAQRQQDCPGVITWIQNLKERNCIQNSCFTFLTPAASYDGNSASFTDIFNDSISFNISLLSKAGEAWVPRIIEELKTSDSLVYQLGVFAKNLALAAGADKEGPTPKGRQDEYTMKAYYELDAAYRNWLESIDPEQNLDIDATMDNWWNTAKEKVREIGRSLILQSGANAFVGHPGQMTSSEAYNLFLYKTSSRENLLKNSGGKK